MSLGLADLKKRNSSKKSSTTSTDAVAEVSQKSQEEVRNAVKPWSNRGLARAGLSRKHEVGVDFHMNHEWIDHQSQSFSWLNLNFDFDHLHGEPELKLQRKLSAFDKKILSSVDTLKNIVGFFGLRSKPARR